MRHRRQRRTEFSEFCGSTGVPFNARAIPSTSGYVKELSFSSLHPNGLNSSWPMRRPVRHLHHQQLTYQALGSRNNGETPSDF